MKTLVLCNGQPPPEPLFKQALAWADLFIAADGGGNIARELASTPDVVIGDLDSYEGPTGHASAPPEVIRKPSQQTNDLEKALHLAHGRGARRVRVLAATGLRLDHTLKNLSVLKQFNDAFDDLCFVDAHGTTRLLPRSYSADIAPGTAVSLFPLSGRVNGITTQGLKYPLNDGYLQNGVRDGSSNTVTASPVHIRHTEGDLLLFIAR